jgi:hypothetical protein
MVYKLNKIEFISYLLMKKIVIKNNINVNVNVDDMNITNKCPLFIERMRERIIIIIFVYFSIKSFRLYEKKFFMNVFHLVE